MQTSVHDRIAEARQALVGAGLEAADAALDAEVLARDVLGWDRATLLARGRETLPPGFEERFSKLLDRRMAREPVALILGRREFWGLDFEVTPEVLIPRPETELIVEEALDDVRGGHPCSLIVDVGTGSGCLAVALACELRNARVLATDVSAAAIAVARRNAVKHGVAPRVSFVQTSFLTGLRATADLIVANPPYVPEPSRGTLQPEVGRYEPARALFSGADGMSAIRAIFADASRVLADAGLLVVEFGFGQAPLLRRDAERAGWRVVRVRPDLQGVPRVAVLRR
jgi:release factor glutamine methyltransferase